MTNFRTAVSIMLVIMTASSTSRPSSGLQSHDQQELSDFPDGSEQSGISTFYPDKYSPDTSTQSAEDDSLMLPEQLVFDNIFVLKFIKAGLMLSANSNLELKTNAAPGDQNPLTLWYITFNTMTQLYSIRSLQYSHKYICMSTTETTPSNQNDDVIDSGSDVISEETKRTTPQLSKAVLSSYNLTLCSFEQKLVTRPMFPASILDYLNLTSPLPSLPNKVNSSSLTLTSSSSSEVKSELPRNMNRKESKVDPLHAMWMSLAFRNPHTGCFLAFNHDSHFSESYCLSDNESDHAELSDIAHFDKEKPEPQLVFQMTSSLRDIYPNHTSIYGIIRSVDTRVKLGLPFNFVDWLTGYSKPQYFLIHTQDYPEIKWTMLKHSYHLYQVPKEASKNPHKWKSHCTFNQFDIFARHAKEAPDAKITVHPSTPDSIDEKMDSGMLQKRFNDLNKKLLAALKSATKNDRSFSRVDQITVELNSISSEFCSIKSKV